jgi:hypothetical protein
MPPRRVSLLPLLPSLRAALAGLALAALAPSVCAFEAVDLLRPSSSGRFPAYPGEPAPLSEFWVQGGAMADSNILRRSSGSQTEEVLRLGVGGRREVPVYGRQTLHLDGEVDGYLYNHFSAIDNLAYGGTAQWLWELGNDLSGTLGISQRRFQRDLAYVQAPVRDIITETHAVANGAYRLGSSFRARAGADWVRSDVSVGAQNELRTTTGVLGLDYVSGLGSTLGVEYRATRGNAPVAEAVDPLGIFVDNSFDQHAVALVAGYVNPFFRLGADIARTKRTYTQIPGRDFDGTTWRATADWIVTPKTALGFETWYEPQSIIDIAATHVVSRGVAFGPGWAPTAKLNFSARVMRERREFSGDPGTVLAPGTFPLQLEIIRNMRLGAYWEYTRQIHLQFAIDHGTRESNLLGRDYSYNALIANLRYIFW